MARKVIDVTIADEGRDKGKVFIITEMSSAQAESWAMRVLLALVGSNVNVPEGFAELGMAGLAEYGIRALASLKWETCEPLLAEMFTCIQIRPDRSKPNIIRAMWDADIDEVSTRLKLRAEWWTLHMDFLQGVVGSTSTSEKASATPKHFPRRPIATSRS